jgi:putative oxidoreductase
MERGKTRLGTAAGPLLILVALGALLGAIGLVLPAAIGTLAWLTPWVAAALAVILLASIAFHVVCREQPKIWVSLILCALAAFVAYGRWT